MGGFEFRWRWGAAGGMGLVAGLLVIAFVSLDPGRAGQAQADTGEPPASALMGDVNCSGGVDLQDVLEVRRWAAGLGPAADCLLLASDVTCDGEPDAADALLLLRFLAGFEEPAPPGCDAIGIETGPRTTSFDLIDAALEASDIDLATALLYKAYAAFGDPRLPVEYKGNDSHVKDNPFLHAVLESWAPLTDEEREALMPFLLPPNLPGSWFEQQPAAATRAAAEDWATLTSATLPVKVWYHTGRSGDDQRASAVLAALEGTIWGRLTGLMGRAPLPDCGAACPSGGGDDRFDIYIVDSSIRSYVKWNPPQPPDCSNVPAFMVLGDTSATVVAHELMHAIQFAFDGPSDCGEYRWVAEATALWAEDYVYPNDNSEHYNALTFLLSPEKRLDLVDDSHEYAAYLYPFFLANQLSPQAIRAIWQAGESKIGSLAAVNQATSGAGGFEELWPEFALKNWNREPVDDYHDWDGLEHGARGPKYVFPGETQLRKSVEYLGAAYYSWDFDDEVGFIDFNNRIAGTPHVKVQAIPSISGTWQEPEDWSEETRKTYCRNLPGQDLDRLVIIVSNSDWQGKSTLEVENDPPKLTSAAGTCEAYTGSASTTLTTDDGMIATASTNNVRFEFDEENEDLPGSDYWSVSGTVTWTIEGTNGDCTLSGSGSFSLANEEGHIFIADANASGDRQYYASGHRELIAAPTATKTCPGSGSQPFFPSFNWIWLRASIASGHYVDDDGRIRGSEQESSNGDIQTWEWDLAPSP